MLPKLTHYFSNLTYQAIITRKDNGNLTEAQALEGIRQIEAHDGLVKLLRAAQQYIRPLDPKYIEIEQALKDEPK